MIEHRSDLGRILKQRRVALDQTLQQLAATSGVSASHLGRIERGQRFPSAHILRKITKPLDFDEHELFTLAEYLTPQQPGVAEKEATYSGRQLDPYAADLLSQEPVDVQRAVIGILTMLKSIARSMTKERVG